MTRAVTTYDANQGDPLAPAMDLWTVDLAASHPGHLRIIRDRAVELIRSGTARKALEALRKPATPKEIAGAVAKLIQDVPPRGEARIPSASFADEISAQRPTAAALEVAITVLRRTATFQPAIAEALQALQAAERDIGAQVALLERLPRRIQEVDRALAKTANTPKLMT